MHLHHALLVAITHAQLAAKTSIFLLFCQGLSHSKDLLFKDEYRGAEDLDQAEPQGHIGEATHQKYGRKYCLLM